MRKITLLMIALTAILLMLSSSCETMVKPEPEPKTPFQTNFGFFIQELKEEGQTANILLICDPEDFSLVFDLQYLTPDQKEIYVPWPQQQIDTWAIEEARKTEDSFRRDLTSKVKMANGTINIIDRAFVDQIIEEQALGLNGLYESSAEVGHLASATHIYHVQRKDTWFALDSYKKSILRTLIDVETSFVEAIDSWETTYLWNKETNEWVSGSQRDFLNGKLIKWDTEAHNWVYVDEY